MKNQALFSLKDKSKELKCCLLQFLFGAWINPNYLAFYKGGHIIQKLKCHVSTTVKYLS